MKDHLLARGALVPQVVRHGRPREQGTNLGADVFGEPAHGRVDSGGRPGEQARAPVPCRYCGDARGVGGCAPRDHGGAGYHSRFARRGRGGLARLGPRDPRTHSPSNSTFRTARVSWKPTSTMPKPQSTSRHPSTGSSSVGAPSAGFPTSTPGPGSPRLFLNPTAIWPSPTPIPLPMSSTTRPPPRTACPDGTPPTSPASHCAQTGPRITPTLPARLNNSRTVQFLHLIGDVIAALLNAGLRLDRFQEHDSIVWQLFAQLQKREHAEHVWARQALAAVVLFPARRQTLKAAFTLSCSVAGTPPKQPTAGRYPRSRR
jgi:hypothetical protein